MMMMIVPFLVVAGIATVYCDGTATKEKLSLGHIHHNNQWYNVVITDTYFVGRLFGTSINHVNAVELEPLQSLTSHVRATKKELSHVGVPLIKSFLDSAGFYFGLDDGNQDGYKLWTTLECNFDASRCPQKQGSVDYSQYFVNNKEMLQLAAMNNNNNAGQDGKMVKAIRGVVSMKCFPVEDGQEQVCTTVMSRTSAYRTAPRMFSRGADTDGHVGNCAEVETVVAQGRKAASFVQFRGSIPFIWSQPPSWLSVMPTVEIHRDRQENYSAFSKHMQHMQALFPSKSHFKVLSLIDSDGALERDLSRTFQDFMNDYKKENTSMTLSYIPFTFNASVNKKADKTKSTPTWQEPWFDALNEQVNLDSVGFTVVDDNGNVQRYQSGIIRTSCLSTLDRTSAVQRQLSDYQTLQILNSVTAPKPPVPAMPAAMLQWLARAWVRLANTIAFQYAGTDAKKTDIIETGRSTVMGRLKDYTVLTTKRHLNANYYDKEKRDVMEVIYGAEATRML